MESICSQATDFADDKCRLLCQPVARSQQRFLTRAENQSERSAVA